MSGQPRLHKRALEALDVLLKQEGAVGEVTSEIPRLEGPAPDGAYTLVFDTHVKARWPRTPPGEPEAVEMRHPLLEWLVNEVGYLLRDAKAEHELGWELPDVRGPDEYGCYRYRCTINVDFLLGQVAPAPEPREVPHG